MPCKDNLLQVWTLFLTLNDIARFKFYNNPTIICFLAHFQILSIVLPILVIVKEMVLEIYFYTKIRATMKALNEISDGIIIGTWHVFLNIYTADTVFTVKEYNSKMDKVVWEFLKMIGPISYYVQMYLFLLDWHILPIQ